MEITGILFKNTGISLNIAGENRDYFWTLKKKSVPYVETFHKAKIHDKGFKVVGDEIEVWQLQKEGNQVKQWVKIGQFKPSVIEHRAGKVIYYSKKYYPKSMFKDVDIEIMYSNDQVIESKGLPEYSSN